MLHWSFLFILAVAFPQSRAVPCPPGESVTALYPGDIKVSTGVQQCVASMQECYFSGSIARGPEPDNHYVIDWADGDTGNHRVHSSLVQQVATGQQCDSFSSGTSKLSGVASESGRPSLDEMKQRFDKAQSLASQYSDAMTNNPTFNQHLQDSLLQQAVGQFQTLESEMMKGYLDYHGRLKMSVAEAKFLLTVVEAIANVLEDMNQADKAIHYLYKLVQYDKCNHFQTTQAVLEYEYCSGKLFSRIIILLRHNLKQPQQALEWYNKAISLNFNGQRVHYWPNEYHTPTLFLPGLRSQPYWSANDLPLARWLEKHYAVFKQDLLAVLNDGKLSNVFTQNDHTLLTKGTWGEQKLYDGKTWKPVCKVANKSCELLKTRSELMGTFPAAKTHNVQMPKEAGYFRLRPGTHLKPHTGPVNFHLYCHLGLIVPEGPRLQVGKGKPRKWEEGKATCFDDSYVHEAWHEGLEDRYVLMITFWHPDVGTPEMEVESSTDIQI